MIVLMVKNMLGGKHTKEDFCIRHIYKSEQLILMNILAVLSIEPTDSKELIYDAQTRLSARVGLPLMFTEQGLWGMIQSKDYVNTERL